jgi:hypothetical protein
VSHNNIHSLTDIYHLTLPMRDFSEHACAFHADTRLCTKSLSLTVITEENEACLISFSWIFPFKQFSLTHQSSN